MDRIEVPNLFIVDCEWIIVIMKILHYPAFYQEENSATQGSYNLSQHREAIEERERKFFYLYHRL